jgi:hypothetical protein
MFRGGAEEDRLEEPQLRDRSAAPEARLRRQRRLLRPRLRRWIPRRVARALQTHGRRHGGGVLERGGRGPGVDEHDRPDRRGRGRRAAGAGAPDSFRHGVDAGIRQHVGDAADLFHRFGRATGGVGIEEAIAGHRGQRTSRSWFTRSRSRMARRSTYFTRRNG